MRPLADVNETSRNHKGDRRRGYWKLTTNENEAIDSSIPRTEAKTLLARVKKPCDGIRVPCQGTRPVRLRGL